jgi:hypothetical protein
VFLLWQLCTPEPPHTSHTDGSGGRGADALKRVLTAFAAHDAALGYVQSMNFLAAFLLLAGVAEEDAFWCLVVLVEDVVPGYFCEGMLAAKVCVCVSAAAFPKLCIVGSPPGRRAPRWTSACSLSCCWRASPPWGFTWRRWG